MYSKLFKRVLDIFCLTASAHRYKIKTSSNENLYINVDKNMIVNKNYHKKEFLWWKRNRYNKSRWRLVI